jgi:hypothetical protein
MPNDNNNKKPPSKMTARERLEEESKRILQSLGVTPEEIIRESNPDLLFPKMALIGILSSIERVCEATKNSIIATAGPLSVQKIAAIMLGLRSSISLAEHSLKEYSDNQAFLKNMSLHQTKFGPNDVYEPLEGSGTNEDYDDEPTDEELDAEASRHPQEPAKATENDKSGFGESYQDFKKKGGLLN